MKKLLALASLLGLFLHVQPAYAGVIDGKVFKIWMSADSNVTIVKFDESGSECGWATAMSFDAGTGGGRGLLSLATAALLSGMHVYATGKGASYCGASNLEPLQGLVLINN